MSSFTQPRKNTKVSFGNTAMENEANSCPSGCAGIIWQAPARLLGPYHGACILDRFGTHDVKCVSQEATVAPSARQRDQARFRMVVPHAANRANFTPYFPHPEASTAQNNYYSLMYPSRSISSATLLMPVNHFPQPSVEHSVTVATLLLQQKSSIEQSYNRKPETDWTPTVKETTTMLFPPQISAGRTNPHFDTPLGLQSKENKAFPQTYRPELTPLNSILQPHCLARDRLRMWIPAGCPPHTNIVFISPNHAIPSEHQLDRILEVIGASWAL
ncbi:hypothetical protein SERLADRAFT_440590 [Serpula lacrymans var. lacrymans S7.9]|uniref:Uncharacterized protein n=1 Tax=Serpula lacrymans var. lacrymans (strain S7.9) TaxID=578457 RepID=F8P344_SERL9|nr:uncharacterized protein SERLADRAFT_440590 [Serpula lacrymans var. lacrymans S7.9]EGO22575.1 hypothetical protein SERLADRAFT_440590 [Serpula lacrymans var. lacrymans S7.9]